MIYRKTLFTVLSVILSVNAHSQIADAGSDKIIYLTEKNAVSIGGSSSGTFYSWKKLYDVVPFGDTQPWYFLPQPINTATIASPAAARTNVIFYQQGTWYFELSVTTGARTKKDTVVVRVEFQPPPKGSILVKEVPFDRLAPMINNRTDTTNFIGTGPEYPIRGKYVRYQEADYLFYIDRARSAGMMVDSSRGKLFSVIEDGYKWNFENYNRTEMYGGSDLNLDSSKTYLFEWQGYYPQVIANIGKDLRYRVLTILQVHPKNDGSPTQNLALTNDTLYFVENPLVGNGEGANPVMERFHALLPTIDMYNKSNTIRVIIKEGKAYTGQNAFVQVFVNGVEKYFRNTGQVGGTWNQSYIKFLSLYDSGNYAVNPANTLRKRKFGLVTENFKVYYLTGKIPVNKAINLKQ